MQLENFNTYNGFRKSLIVPEYVIPYIEDDKHNNVIFFILQSIIFCKTYFFYFKNIFQK